MRDLTLKQIEGAMKRILKVPGVTAKHDSWVLIDQVGDTMFMKFMSDNGKTDVSNGFMLMRHLCNQQVRFRTMSDTLDPDNQSQMRKLDMLTVDFKRLFVR